MLLLLIPGAFLEDFIPFQQEHQFFMLQCLFKGFFHHAWMKNLTDLQDFSRNMAPFSSAGSLERQKSVGLYYFTIGIHYTDFSRTKKGQKRAKRVTFGSWGIGTSAVLRYFVLESIEPVSKPVI